MKDVKKFYNDQAHKWSSDKPRTISDLVARPAVVDICRELDLKDKTVLDLGCGEGYIGRKVSKISKKIIGVDLSEEMIKFANKKKGANEEYFVSDMRKLDMPRNSIDFVISVMSLHYLEKFNDLVLVFNEVARVLKKGGEFVFLIPHPLGVLINEDSKCYVHEKFEFNYLKDEGRYFGYKISLLNREGSLDVGLYFHSLASYSKALKEAGFVITEISEPAPTKEIVEKHQADVEERIPSFLIIKAISK